ncbi:hypothetical protein AB1L05_13115 [Cytobacillus horneckiae]
MKLYSKPNKNGHRQFLGWEASYWALKKKYDYLAKGYWKKALHSEQIQRYQESQRTVMELEKELKSARKQLRKIARVYECGDYDNKDKVDNIGFILGYDD